MKTMIRVVAGGLAFSAAATAFAAETDVRAELDALKATVQSQQKELQQLRAVNGESWLNERRAEEVKALVREVLSDADTRASLAEGGMTGGYKDGFFLASEDGNFLLRLEGQVQTRYIYNNSDDNDVRHEEGFSIPRAKIGFYGHVYDPKFTYGVRFVASDATDDPTLGKSFDENVADGEIDNGEVALEEAWFAYEFADGWHVKGGQFKGPFLRDELVDSRHQLAVERAMVTDFFTVDYTQGAQLSYTSDMWRVAVMLHDGSYAANSAWAFDAVDFAVAGRAEVLLAGTWEQFKDYATWSSQGFGLMIGAGADYENGSGEDGDTPGDVLKWTLDASVEVPEMYGLNGFAAIMGNHTDARESEDEDDEIDQYGFVVQAGVFIIPDKLDIFGRWEWADLDEASFDGGDANDDVSLFTVGGNYYFQGHGAKLTVDVVWAEESDVPINGDLHGITNFGSDDQFAIRGQFQFLF